MFSSRGTKFRNFVLLIVFSTVYNSRAQNFSMDISQARSGYSDNQHHHHGHPHHVIHTTQLHHGGGHHGHGASHFSSFFDIALTALAFLAFGIFLLNLLLNALTTTTTTTTTTVAPTATGGTGIITDTANTARTRGKREIFDLHLERYVSIEALAASILKSIDAMVIEHECLEKVFCDANKEANLIGSGFQYLMPAYSLGASYIGRKAGFHDSFSNHVKAVALGVGEDNCQAHFPHC